MSGVVRVKGSASQAAGATAHGGLLVIEGDAGARCGISMKGIDIVVGGSIGHMSCFMGQAGRLVVLQHAEQRLGFPLFLRVRGKLQPTPVALLEFLLAAARARVVTTHILQGVAHRLLVSVAAVRAVDMTVEIGRAHV